MSEGYRAPLAGVPYVLVCTVLGAGLGWVPKLFHGPIPYKFDIHYLHGELMMWAYYSGRMLVGFWVGVSSWPRPWWLRGPMCGFVTMLPVVFISLATPECGVTCFEVNLTSATLVGLAVAGIAFALTGKHHH